MAGRRRKVDRPAERTVSIPSSVIHAVEDRLPRNPLTGRLRYGALSGLVETLLRDWLAKQRDGFTLPPEEKTIDIDSLFPKEK